MKLSPRTRQVLLLLLAVVVVIVVLVWQRSSDDSRSGEDNRTGRTSSPSGDSVDVADLPEQARDTLDLIRSGGPFPYPRNDGVVFGNRERLLPQQPGGYYHEYTVPTPGSHDRGARRIVTGGPKQQPSEYYYSDDHYESFRLIRGVS